MQQDHEIARRLAARVDLARVVTEQPHAVAALDDLRLRARDQLARAAHEQRTAQPQARHDRLQMGVHEPGGRRERGERCDGHESMRIGEDPGSVVTKSGPTSSLGVANPDIRGCASNVVRIPSDDATVSE